MQEENHFCAFCNHIAERRCGACQTVYYCSKEHQKIHWETHSKNCRAYKLVENSQRGKHYVATRDIKVGETVIYDKAPLITTPNYMKVTVAENGNCSVNLDIPPVCLSCYVRLSANNVKLCEKCGWPLCQKCTRHGSECEFTKEHQRSKLYISPDEYGKPHPAYAIIGVIRALALRENDPQSYQKLMNHSDLYPLDTDSFSKAARYTKKKFRINGVRQAEICKILRILLINCNIIQPTETSRCVLYDAQSYIEHNCTANCSESLTDEGGAIVWAAVPISKGDHITISYVDSLLRTIPRRNTLQVKHLFECKCKRCEDPTEFGTMYSVLKCVSETCDGYMLPPTSSVTKVLNWYSVCSKCRIPADSSLLAVNWIIHEEWDSVDISDINKCEYFIAKWKNFLPENHFFIVDAELQSIHIILNSGHDLTKQSDERLIRLVQRCKKLTKLVKTLAPAENRVRGKLLYLHYCANKVLFTRNEPKEQDKKKNFLMECKKMLDEIYLLLHREPTSFRLPNRILRNVVDEINELSTGLPKLEQQLSACSI